MTIQIQSSTTFMFSHLIEMCLHNNKHPYLIKQGNSHISNTLAGIYLKFHTNLGFDGPMCIMGSNVCKQCNLHVNNSKVVHSTSEHKRTLLSNFAQVLTPLFSCSHFNDMFIKTTNTPSQCSSQYFKYPNRYTRQALHSARVRCSNLNLHIQAINNKSLTIHYNRDTKQIIQTYSCHT